MLHLCQAHRLEVSDIDITLGLLVHLLVVIECGTCDSTSFRFDGRSRLVHHVPCFSTSPGSSKAAATFLFDGQVCSLDFPFPRGLSETIVMAALRIRSHADLRAMLKHSPPLDQRHQAWGRPASGQHVQNAGSTSRSWMALAWPMNLSSLQHVLETAYNSSAVILPPQVWFAHLLWRAPAGANCVSFCSQEAREAVASDSPFRCVQVHFREASPSLVARLLYQPPCTVSGLGFLTDRVITGAPHPLSGHQVRMSKRASQWSHALMTLILGLSVFHYAYSLAVLVPLLDIPVATHLCAPVLCRVFRQVLIRHPNSKVRCQSAMKKRAFNHPRLLNAC